MKRVFQSTAPKYLNLPGLLRKNYFLSEDGLRAGGIYVWESKAQAKHFYSPEWRSFVAGNYTASSRRSCTWRRRSWSTMRQAK